MEYNGKNFRLKDGSEARLRMPTLQDAQALLEYLVDTAAQTPFLLRTPEECVMTLEQEERYLEKALNSPDKLMLLCEVEGKLAGNCQFERKNRRKTCHRAMVGIALLREYWGLGIGTEMFRELIRMAKELGIEQLELEVIEGNERALALYEKMGFRITGEKPNAIRLEDGIRLKEFYMVREL